ncbi:MAG: tetratricopeptide repeat protein [Gemmataceae bacterium]
MKSGAWRRTWTATACRTCSSRTWNALRAAVSARPDLDAAHLALGELLLKTGHRDEAIAALENAVRAAPDNAAAKAKLHEARTK